MSQSQTLNNRQAVTTDVHTFTTAVHTFIDNNAIDDDLLATLVDNAEPVIVMLLELIADLDKDVTNTVQSRNKYMTKLQSVTAERDHHMRLVSDTIKVRLRNTEQMRRIRNLRDVMIQLATQASTCSCERSDRMKELAYTINTFIANDT